MIGNLCLNLKTEAKGKSYLSFHNLLLTARLLFEYILFDSVKYLLYFNQFG